MMRIIKRDGREVPYDYTRIKRAIEAANGEVAKEDRLSDTEVGFIVGRIEQRDAGLLVWIALAHLGGRVVKGHYPGAGLEESAVRDNKGLSVLVVYAYGEVSRELYVLLLVVSDRNDVRVVKQNVSRHK